MTDPVGARLRALLGPAGPELSCEDCFSELDRWADLDLAGHPTDHAIPGMRAHLEGCPACAEDAASLRALLAADAT